MINGKPFERIFKQAPSPTNHFTLEHEINVLHVDVLFALHKELFYRNIYVHVLQILDKAMGQLLNCIRMDDIDLFILHSQYHDCWCPGDT